MNPFDTQVTWMVKKILTYGYETERNGVVKCNSFPKYNEDTGIYAVSLFNRNLKTPITNAKRQGKVMRSPLALELTGKDAEYTFKLENACNEHNIICRYEYSKRNHAWIEYPIETKEELGEILGISHRNAISKTLKALTNLEILRIGTIPIFRNNKKINISVFYLSPLIMYYGGISIFLYEAFRDCLYKYLNPKDNEELEALYSIYKNSDKYSFEKLKSLTSQDNSIFVDEYIAKKIESDTTTLSDKINLIDWSVDARKTSTESYENFITCSMDSSVPHSVKQVKSKNKKKFIVEDFPKEDTENLFYMTQPVIDNPGQKTHGKSIVKEYKYLPIDIDIKTEDGAIPDENIDTLEKDKQYILDNLISLFPEPISLTKTRNGWQMLYELSTPISDVDEWRKTLRDKVYSILKGIIDTNAGGAGSLFRYPGSTHHKEGTAPYTTVLYHASRKAHTVDSLLEAFQSKEIKKAVKDIIKTMPQYFKKTKKSKILPQNTSFFVEDISDNKECMILPNSLKLYNVNPKNYDYYEAISKMDIDYFRKLNKDKPVVKLKFADAFDYISRQSIAEFLKLEKGNQSRRCIFHNDTDPSCIINDFGDKNSKQCISTYYCFNCTKGHAMDIFNIVSKFVFKENNRNFSSVEKFLHIVYNIEII